MKTYEEMAQNALLRGKAIAKQRKKMGKIILSATSGLVVCCLAIVMLFGIGEYGPIFGKVNYLSVVRNTDAGVYAEAIQYITGSQHHNEGSGLAAARRFCFDYRGINVVAKAAEDLGIYQTLNEYGSTQTYSYRLFRMEVTDPLQSGIEGSFYYLLPENLKGDLTQYDALLISMRQLPKNFVLRRDNELTAFAYLFADPQDIPEWGNILAFNDGIFDEFFWLDNGWFSEFSYQMYAYTKYEKPYGDAYGEDTIDDHLVSIGSTLEEALQRRQMLLDEWERSEQAKPASVKHYAFQTETARQALNNRKPFENGIFFPERNSKNYFLRRYINGCPTSEWISIDYDTETVTTSEHSFKKEDIEKLPNLSAYIANLDLTQIAPQHLDTSGKNLIYNSAVGWYEKTENGVYAIVRIAWQYQGNVAWHHLGGNRVWVYQRDLENMKNWGSFYDETFILLEENGDRVISREDLIELIGENPNISNEEYGTSHLWLV